MICNGPFKVIATGSQGNAVVMGEEILIDCGVPFKRLEPYIQRLQLVLLTHRHGDHFNPATVRRLHQTRPTLRFACGSWMVPHLLDAGVSPRNIDPLDLDVVYAYKGGAWLVRPFPLRHDVDNCGWKIHIYDGRIRRYLYATDTSTLEHVEAKGFDWYLIEANHTEAGIAERIERKEEAGEFCYEYRAKENHLSREAADLWLAMNAGPGSQVIYLHGHQE